jgi:lipopolysaccharide biosynthesis protein
MSIPNQKTVDPDISEAEVEAFRTSGLFDQAWYLNEYPDVAISKIDPARHYLWVGRRLGRMPSPAYYVGTPAPLSGNDRNLPASVYERAWRDGFAVAQGARSPDFAPMAMTSVPRPVNAPKIVAFYLPQFHTIKENDEWWGAGFTEWTNVTKAMPQYKGHYQPKLPLDLGFYDLRNIDVIRAQVALAKTNGVDAFCFHYYWFDGHRLLEKPVEAYLADKGETLDLPFCLCWANENWTRRWDGSESDMLMEQSHSLEDHSRVFEDLSRFFADPRYLTVDGKPIIVIYRPAIIKQLDAMVSIWRRAAEAAGLPGIHLVATNSFGFSDPGSIGFDALCEFPPHNVVVGEGNAEKQWYNPAHQGSLYAYGDVVDFCTTRLRTIDNTPAARSYYPTLMMGWDNEARKPGRGNVFDGCTPALFRQWLDAAVDFSQRNHTPGDSLVFVNAWNEWAEGTYLEPDRQFGHAYLWAVRSVLEERVRPDPQVERMVAQANEAAGARATEGAICLHLFYPDLIDELANWTRAVRSADSPLDVLLSLPQTWNSDDVVRALAQLQPRRTFLVPNRGRDVLPFLQVAREATRMGYSYGCKVHSKKSAHLSGGNNWRTSIYSALLSADRAEQAREVFHRQPRCGLYAPAAMVKSCSDPSTMRDSLDNLSRVFGAIGGSVAELDKFVAGTMFWFRFAALKTALDPRFGADWFGPELGAIDGTMAHAFERLMVHFGTTSGYELVTYADHIDDPYR